MNSAVKESIFPVLEMEKASPLYEDQDVSKADLSGLDFGELGEDMGAGEILSPQDPGAYGEEDDSEPLEEPDSSPDDFPEGSQEDLGE